MKGKKSNEREISEQAKAMGRGEDALRKLSRAPERKQPTWEDFVNLALDIIDVVRG